jgi:hypothetical protein
VILPEELNTGGVAVDDVPRNTAISFDVEMQLPFSVTDKRYVPEVDAV